MLDKQTGHTGKEELDTLIVQEIQGVGNIRLVIDRKNEDNIPL